MTARPARLLVLVVGVLLAGVVGTAAPATAADGRTLLVQPCSGPDESPYKPSVVVIWCIGSGGSYHEVSWTSWTRRRAVAKAINYCPSGCGDARPDGYPSTLVFDRPKMLDGQRAFTRVRITTRDVYDNGVDQRSLSVFGFRRSIYGWFEGCKLMWAGPSDESLPVCRRLRDQQSFP